MTDFLAELERLKDAATKGPWWKWPDMPYLFSGDKTQKNAYMHATRVCRIDYTDADGELLQFLRNHADEIAELVKTVNKHVCVNKLNCKIPQHCELCDVLANLNKEKS